MHSSWGDSMPERRCRNHHGCTTTGVPGPTRPKRRRRSSLRTRMQPFETAPPISSGRFVPWIAIGPPCVQPVSTFGERRDPDRARPEGTGRVGGHEPLVDVVAARRRRRLPVEPIAARVGEHAPAAVEERSRRRSERSTSIRVVTGREGDVAGRHPARDAVRPHRKLDAVPVGAARSSTRSRQHREDGRDAVHVLGGRSERGVPRPGRAIRRRVPRVRPPRTVVSEPSAGCRPRNCAGACRRIRAHRLRRQPSSLQQLFRHGTSELVGQPESPPQPAMARTARARNGERIRTTVAAVTDAVANQPKVHISSPFRYLFCPTKRLP